MPLPPPPAGRTPVPLGTPAGGEGCRKEGERDVERRGRGMYREEEWREGGRAEEGRGRVRDDGRGGRGKWGGVTAEGKEGRGEEGIGRKEGNQKVSLNILIFRAIYQLLSNTIEALLFRLMFVAAIKLLLSAQDEVTLLLQV